MASSFFTVEQCQTQLQLWLDASAALATGKAVTVGGRSLSRASADEIERMINLWENRLSKAKGRGGPRIRMVDPI